MSSPSLTRGSLYEILEFPASLRGRKATEARNSRFMLGILDFALGILEFLVEILEFLGILDCQKPKVFICYFARALRKYQVLLAFFLSKKQARKID